MRSLNIFLIAVAMTFAASVLPTKAAPLPAPDRTIAANTASIVQKTHGWHYDCRWGPIRYHRHVPGIGNVPCRHPRYYRKWRNWEHDDHEDYYRRRYYRERDWNHDDDYDD